MKNRKPDPDCPPNHVRLSEDERRRVLTNLQKCESISKFMLNDQIHVSGLYERMGFFVSFYVIMSRTYMGISEFRG